MKDKPKIIFIATVYGHLVNFHIPYMRYFQKQGYEVWAAGSFGKGKNTKKILEAQGFFCKDIPFSRNPLNINNIKALQCLINLFKANEFTLIHVHTPIAAFLTRIAKRKKTSGQLVYTVHGFHFYKGAPLKNWLYYYPFEKMTISRTDALITINKEDYKRAQKMGYENKRVYYVHGVGVEPSEEIKIDKTKFKKRLNIPLDSKVISYVAELNHNKNQEFLLRNWKEIKNLNPKAVLLIIGRGPLEIQYKEYLEKNKLQDVYMLGYRSDVRELLKITDIVALLSYREGLPKSIMEAQEEGIPCIVSDTRGLRDLVQTSINGIVVKQDNNEELIQSFYKLLQSEHLRKKMGKNGQESVQKFNIDSVLEEYKGVYNNLLA